MSETNCQYHQHITRSFYVQNSFPKLFLNFSLVWYFLLKEYKWKAACKMLVKLITGVDFAYILQTVFTREDPKGKKRHWRLDCLFCPFGICTRKSCTYRCWWNWLQERGRERLREGEMVEWKIKQGDDNDKERECH